MEYFSQFKWAIPHAFADALSRCQFGEGDVLYPKKTAYQDWDAQRIDEMLQVVYPARQVNAAKGELDEDSYEVFKRNWNMEVRVQKYSCSSPKAEAVSKDGDEIVSTQGRLYTAIWKGDLSLLDTNSKPPKIPTIDTKEMVRLREVVPEIKENGVVIQERVLEQYLEKSRDSALNTSKNKVVFVMPYDRSNSTSTQKYQSICSALEKDMEGSPILVHGEKTGIDEWNDLLPTLHVAIFITPNLDENSLLEKIKGVTYKPSKNRKTNVDRYDIKRHGLIFSN